MAFQDLFWKFERAAGHVGRCEAALRAWEVRRQGSQDGSSLDDPDLEANYAAHEDLPLYLDLLLIYLRSQVDVFTTFVGFVYERPVKERSFRDMRKWFISKSLGFDPVFTEILRANTEWFDLLSGAQPEAKGLRELVVHYRGVHRIGWTPETKDSPFRLRPWLLGDQGQGTDDTLEAIKTITTGWFAFLDACFAHFVSILKESGFSLEVVTTPGWWVILGCNGNWRPSYWVYPQHLPKS